MSVTEADLAQVSAALELLQEGFVQDGGSLAVEGAGDSVEVRLVLTDESCADCIVGPEIFRSIVLGRLQDAGVTAPVTVRDPRE
ncbi:hypothetical protein [Blastococcus sp. SYSU DS0616]